MRKLDQDLFMQPATWLVSRQLTEAAGPWDTRLTLDDDGEYFCRVVRASAGIRFVPEAKVFYRRGLDTLSSMTGSPRKLESQLLALELQISHLRSLEESERIRRVCVNALRNYAICFYPERMDLFQRMCRHASDLGGQLETPKLPVKYAWMQRVFGWSTAKRAQNSYNRLKASILRSIDQSLFRLENRRKECHVKP
jgi:GT2 family glycosyltransferase